MFAKIKKLIADNTTFLSGLKSIEIFISKILSIGMILVALLAIFQLGYVLTETIMNSFRVPGEDDFNRTLFQLFGLFLNVLIALEILENVAAYLKKKYHPSRVSLSHFTNCRISENYHLGSRKKG
jgi:uncharacterized membrane protein (DUF373 family)